MRTDYDVNGKVIYQEFEDVWNVKYEYDINGEVNRIVTSDGIENRFVKGSLVYTKDENGIEYFE